MSVCTVLCRFILTLYLHAYQRVLEEYLARKREAAANRARALGNDDPVPGVHSIYHLVVHNMLCLFHYSRVLLPTIHEFIILCIFS